MFKLICLFNNLSFDYAFRIKCIGMSLSNLLQSLTCILFISFIYLYFFSNEIFILLVCECYDFNFLSILSINNLNYFFEI